jgi:hypothetical protein
VDQCPVDQCPVDLSLADLCPVKVHVK